MLPLLKDQVIRPLARRLGSLVAGALLASAAQVDADAAQQIASGLTALVLVVADLVISYAQRRG